MITECRDSSPLLELIVDSSAPVEPVVSATDFATCDLQTFGRKMFKYTIAKSAHVPYPAM